MWITYKSTKQEWTYENGEYLVIYFTKWTIFGAQTDPALLAIAKQPYTQQTVLTNGSAVYVNMPLEDNTNDQTMSGKREQETTSPTDQEWKNKKPALEGDVVLTNNILQRLLDGQGGSPRIYTIA